MTDKNFVSPRTIRLLVINRKISVLKFTNELYIFFHLFCFVKILNTAAFIYKTLEYIVRHE